MAQRVDATPSPYYSSQRKDILSMLPDKYFAVLEIGCGLGNFRENLDCEHIYWGVEPNVEAANEASHKLDKVLVGTFKDVCRDIPNHHFDLVICCDVMEHMVDHEEFLELIKEKIKEGGCIVGSVPNVRFAQNLFNMIFRKDWEYTSSGILDRTHLRFFTKKSVVRMLEKHNYSIERLEGLNGVTGSALNLNRLRIYIFILLFGADSRFLQYGFRIREG